MKETTKPMINKRNFIKTALLSAIPTGFATKLAASTQDDLNQNKILSIILSKLKLAAKDGSAGFYKAGEAPGLATGSAIAEGYIGEQLTASPGDIILTTSGTPFNAASISLTAGTWLVYGKVCVNPTPSETFGETTVCISDVGSSATIDEANLVLEKSQGTNYGRRVAACPKYVTTKGGTIYLVVSAGFTGNAPHTYGKYTSFYAVRIA